MSTDEPSETAASNGIATTASEAPKEEGTSKMEDATTSAASSSETKKTNSGMSQDDETEQMLGICAYRVPGEGFSAVVKARYSDFLVHEVDLNGNIVRLTNRDVPSSRNNNDKKDYTEPAKEETLKKEPTTDWSELQKELQDMIKDADIAAKVMSVLQSHKDNKDCPEKFVTLPELEKVQRKEVHQWVRNSLPCARADTLEGKIRIWHVKFEKEMPNYNLFKRSNDNNPRNKKKQKSAWPDDRPNFLQFVLYKENMDTTTATKELSRKGSKARIGYAGMKDKRGITTQLCTLYKTEPEQIMSAHSHGGGNTKQRGYGVVQVGNFSYVDKELRLGSLKGNRFDIVLRNVVVSATDTDKKQVLESAAQAMKEKGFINYFGTQRFGKYKTTHKTGVAILQGDFKKAIEIILEPKPDDRADAIQVKKEWQARFENGETDENEVKCAKKFLRTLNRFMTAENSILQSLSRKPRDYKRAFTCIPKTLRMMFLHAVQSLIWNQAVSYRLTDMNDNDKVQVGDLVMTEGESEPKLVTEEDLDKYTIEDIVLPLVGVKSKFPTNESGAKLKKLFEDIGVDVQMFKKIQDKDLNVGGDYRKAVIRPRDFNFKVMEYYDPVQPLLRTDLMELNDQDIEIAPQKDEEESLKFAMIVGFTLPSSAYATIALRELMKRPTSTDYQKDLKLG